MKLHGGFRQDIENSDKTYGFLMPGRGKRVYAFEAPIDAISHATLCKRFGIDWTKDYRVSRRLPVGPGFGTIFKRTTRRLRRSFSVTTMTRKAIFRMGHLTIMDEVKAEEMKKKYEKLGYWTAIQTPHLKKTLIRT
ncbi:MAG: hypothetical protein ACLTQG_30395 [Hungatella sp.]|uniref:hypothetical protein n=1 Tax=Hungatella sp. TaxID=2613924 RepID=UPI00399419DA